MDAALLYRDDLHPRLFCDRSDLKSLDARRDGDVVGRALAELRRRADVHADAVETGRIPLDQGRLAVSGQSGWGTRYNLASVFEELGFAHFFDPSPRRVGAIEKLLDVIADPDGPSARHAHPFGFRYDAPDAISLASFGGMLPLAWDLAFDDLSSPIREKARQYLRQWIVDPYRDTFLADRRKYDIGIGVNPVWHELVTYAWTLGAIYDPGRPEDRAMMELLADLVRKTLHQGVDEQGFIGEGPNYGRHTLWRWMTIASILERAGFENLFQTEPLLMRCVSNWLYLLLPGRGQIINPQDTPRTYGASPLLALLLAAHRTGDPTLHWAWREISGRAELRSDRPPFASEGHAPESLADGLGFVILWDRDDLPSVRPPNDAPHQDAGLTVPPSVWPRTREPGDFGVCVSRSGWGDDDLVFGLNAAGRTPSSYIHQHTDAGHFNLYALGEAFSIDTGYGDKQGRHHSVMMPLGEEPKNGPVGGFEQVWFGGHVERWGVSDHADYACVDINHQWDCYSYWRHGLTVRLPGAEPYVVLLDEANHRADWSFYDWLMQTEPGNRIELDVERNQAAITGVRFGHRCEIAWVTPHPEDFPARHRVELRTDVQDSTPFYGPDRDKGLGVGPRPRLIARLWGYNGSMLTALTPRRADQPRAHFTPIAGPSQYGLVIDHGEGVRDTVVVNSRDRHLDLEGVQGEAAIAVVRHDADGAPLGWAAGGAYAVAWRGQPLLPRQGRRMEACGGLASEA